MMTWGHPVGLSECPTLTLRSAFCDEILTATDTMLRASRPMPSEGVEDLSGDVSDW